MRKVIISTMMTLDAVIENPQNWSFDYTNEEFMQYASEQLLAADALIMGRETYQGFSEAWSSRAGSNAFADRMNALPKYVASRTLSEPLSWNAALLKGDAASEIAQLKTQGSGILLQYGCGEFTQTLLEHDLIDELRLLVYPVVAGGGQRLFEKLNMTKFTLLSATPLSTGVMTLHYQPVAKG